jgi:hypothetical protein
MWDDLECIESFAVGTVCSAGAHTPLDVQKAPGENCNIPAIIDFWGTLATYHDGLSQPPSLSLRVCQNQRFRSSAAFWSNPRRFRFSHGGRELEQIAVKLNLKRVQVRSACWGRFRPDIAGTPSAGRNLNDGLIYRALQVLQTKTPA